MHRGDAKRAQILKAVEKLLASHRPHEITTDEIARVAAVGKGTIYRYFQDKDDLFYQVAMEGFETLCELLQTDVPADAPFQDQLLLAGAKITGFFRSRRQLFRMMQSDEARMPWCRGEVREQWRASRQRLVEAVARIMDRGVAEGRLRRDVPPEILAVMFLGMLRTWARDLADQPDDVRSHELLVELFCHGGGAGSTESVSRQEIVDGL